MSLIIGKANQNGQVIILGDTKINLENKDRSNPYIKGCLKQYIVNEKVAFGFAGTVEHFEDVLPLLLNCNNAREIAETALQFKKENQSDFDLLIGEAGDPELTVLKEGEILRTPSSYIGDKDAFEKYQSCFHDGVNPDSSESNSVEMQLIRLPEPLWKDDIYAKMFNAFKHAINNSSITSIGGAVIPLCTDNERFLYMNYAEVLRNQIDWSQYSNKPKIIDFGTAENGSFAIELCGTTPNNVAKIDIGFYIIQGGFGIVFPENENRLRKAKYVKAENPAYWFLNSGITSSYMIPDHCGIAGEILAKQEKWGEALTCYRMVKDPKCFLDRISIYDRFIAGYSVTLFNNGYVEDSITKLEKALESELNLPMCKHHILKIKAQLDTVNKSSSS